MTGISRSGPLVALAAQIFWFGQPLQASALPACSDSGPGQCSEEIVRCNFGSGYIHHDGVHTWFWGHEFCPLPFGICGEGGLYG